jgi:hypothetical protein
MGKYEKDGNLIIGPWKKKEIIEEVIDKPHRIINSLPKETPTNSLSFMLADGDDGTMVMLAVKLDHDAFNLMKLLDETGTQYLNVVQFEMVCDELGVVGLPIGMVEFTPLEDRSFWIYVNVARIAEQGLLDMFIGSVKSGVVQVFIFNDKMEILEPILIDDEQMKENMYQTLGNAIQMYVEKKWTSEIADEFELKMRGVFSDLSIKSVTGYQDYIDFLAAEAEQESTKVGQEVV